MDETTYVETTYKCLTCGAEDHDRGHGIAPTVLNCWQCGAGRGREIQAQIAAHQGMFPVAPEGETAPLFDAVQ